MGVKVFRPSRLVTEVSPKIQANGATGTRCEPHLYFMAGEAARVAVERSGSCRDTKHRARLSASAGFNSLKSRRLLCAIFARNFGPASYMEQNPPPTFPSPEELKTKI